MGMSGDMGMLPVTFIRTLNMTGDMDISPVILQFDAGCEGLP